MLFTNNSLVKKKNNKNNNKKNNPGVLRLKNVNVEIKICTNTLMYLIKDYLWHSIENIQAKQNYVYMVVP